MPLRVTALICLSVVVGANGHGQYHRVKRNVLVPEETLARANRIRTGKLAGLVKSA